MIRSAAGATNRSLIVNSICRTSSRSVISPVWWLIRSLVTRSSTDRPAGSSADARSAMSRTRVRSSASAAGDGSGSSRPWPGMPRIVAYSGLAWKYSSTSSSASDSTVFVTPANLPVFCLVLPPLGHQQRGLLAEELEELPARLQPPARLRLGADGDRALLHELGPRHELLVPVRVGLVPHVVGDLVVVAALAGVSSPHDQ